MLLEEGAISKAGFNGPYADSYRQKGFVSFGVSHVMKILGSAELAQRSSWYQKWNVHLFARPEVTSSDPFTVNQQDADRERGRDKGRARRARAYERHRIPYGFSRLFRISVLFIFYVVYGLVMLPVGSRKKPALYNSGPRKQLQTFDLRYTEVAT